jgi:hypothetical protein
MWYQKGQKAQALGCIATHLSINIKLAYLQHCKLKKANLEVSSFFGKGTMAFTITT